MGVILKRAVQAFLDRPRKDFRPWKKYSDARLVEIRDKRLPARPPVWNVLRKHQKVCLLIGALERYFGFFLDTGMGKTFLILALLQYFLKIGVQKKSTLILVPNKTNKREWARSVRKHSPHLVILQLQGSSEDKWRQLLGSDTDLVVETYGGLARMISTLVKAKKKKKLTGKRKLVLNDALIKKLMAHFDGFVMDESIKVMNKSSIFYRMCWQFRKTSAYAFELNATPFGRDPLPVWSQINLLDLGQSLGETLGLFRAAFYTTSQNYWGGEEHKFNRRKERMLHDFIAAKTISYETDEGDLPRVVPAIKEIPLPRDAADYAERARDAILAARGNYRETRNAFLRMRQISSGWLGYKDDETGEKAAFEFPENPKLDFLLDYLDRIRPEHKWIVFHEFNHSGRMVSDALKEEGHRFAWIYGKTKDPDAEYDRFLEDPHCQGLLLSSAGAYGLNLQIARYGIFYESPVSPIIRYQTRKRYQRQDGPHKTVYQTDLVVPGTYDQRILDFHEQGRDLFEAIVRGEFKPRRGVPRA